MKPILEILNKEFLKKLLTPVVKISRDVELLILIVEETFVEIYDEFQSDEDSFMDQEILDKLRKMKLAVDQKKEIDKKINSPYDRSKN